MGAERHDSASPIAPLWRCWDAQVPLSCACGRREVIRPSAAFAGQNPNTPLFELVGRLKCSCGRRPSIARLPPEPAPRPDDQIHSVSGTSPDGAEFSASVTHDTPDKRPLLQLLVGCWRVRFRPEEVYRMARMMVRAEKRRP